MKVLFFTRSLRLITCFCCLTAYNLNISWAHKSQKTCNETLLTEAKLKNEQGLYDNVISVLLECLPDRFPNKEMNIQAHEIIVRAYVNKRNDLLNAEYWARRLHKLNKRYPSQNPDTDYGSVIERTRPCKRLRCTRNQIIALVVSVAVTTCLLKCGSAPNPLAEPPDAPVDFTP